MNRHLIYTIIISLIGVFFAWLVVFSYFNFYQKEDQTTFQDNAVESKNDFNQEESKNFDGELKTSAFITPHHLAAEELIEEIFKKTSIENEGLKIDRIVLISPDHFNSSKENFIVSNESWNLEESSILPDDETIQFLQKEKIAYVQNDAFKQEHGITALLPFINKYYPKVKIIPLIIKDNSNESSIDNLSNLFSEEVEGNTLMILSSDFSHELDKNISFVHDQVAIDTIENFDFENVNNLETDCTSGLRLIMNFAQSNNYKDFYLIKNSNSSEVYNEFFIGENTSYVTGYFTRTENNSLSQAKKRSINMLFGGDVMLDRSIRLSINKSGVKNLTEKIQRLFLAEDIVMVNLEGPVTSNKSISNVPMDNPKHYLFTFDKNQTKEFLNLNNINVVTVGNNHILNFYQDGEQETKQFLEDNDIAYTGMPSMQENNSVIKNVKDRKIAFVTYNYAAGLTQDEVVQEIEKMKKESDFVVVSAHWGLEYYLRESENQKILAHKFVDAGADVIIGSHPHVVQPVEVYKDKVIFYSLGNLVFDQYFSKDVQERLMVNLLLKDDKIYFVLVPLYVNSGGQLELMKLNQRTEFLNRIANDSTVSDIIKNGIREGMFSLNLR